MPVVTGTDEADVLDGSRRNDSISGLGGDDVIDGRDGNDFLAGGAGDDAVMGGGGSDLIFGGAGSDAISGGDGLDFLIADDLSDSKLGTADILDGGAGDDQLYAGWNDTVRGGDGFDHLYLDWVAVTTALTGVLRFPMANGSGTIDNVEQIEWTLSSADDVVRVDASLDPLVTVVNGGEGNDVMRGFREGLTFAGGNGDDRFVVSTDNAIHFEGGNGFDTISYLLVEGPIVADLENAHVTRTISGSAIVDNVGIEVEGIVGTRFDDTIGGLNGLFAYDGGFFSYEGEGDDRLDGGKGNDILNGQGGLDILLGGAGDDVLNGGQQYDELTGGRGADRFIFDFMPNDSIEYFGPDSGGPDRRADLITDFSPREGDRIDLSTFDADALADGRQAPTFIGRASPTGMAGEMWFTRSTDGLFIHIDRDGDMQSDYDIHLAGKHNLAASDFFL